METADRGLAGRQDRVAVLDDLVRRESAIRAPEIHRAAAGVKPQTNRRGGANLDLEEVPRVAGEDVMVVGRRRAARARERGQTGARRCPARVGVDQRPHRVELDQPLEQRRLLRESARGPLVEVVMAVDETGRRQVAAAVDPAGFGPTHPARPIRRGSLTDSHDPLALDHDVPVAILGPGRVDGRDCAAFDHCAHGHVCSAPAIRSLGEPDGVEDLLVARAPAKIARQRLADLGVARARVAAQQVVAGHDQSRRAEPALHARPPRRTRVAPRPGRRHWRSPRPSRHRGPAPARRARGRSTRPGRRGRPSRTRTRPVRRRSSSRGGPDAPAARRAGSPPPMTPSTSRCSPLTVRVRRTGTPPTPT